MTEATPFTFLSEARDRAGLTQSELARLARTHVSHLNKVEGGTRGLSPRLRNRIAAILGLTIDEMIDNAPKPPKQARPSDASGVVEAAVAS